MDRNRALCRPDAGKRHHLPYPRRKPPARPILYALPSGAASAFPPPPPAGSPSQAGSPGNRAESGAFLCIQTGQSGNLLCSGQRLRRLHRGAARRFPGGEFISPEGVPCGKHKGIIHYTVGQRKRLGIALGRPVFIREIDPAANRIYLADGDGVFEQEILVSEIAETFPGAIKNGMEASVKIRSRADAVPAKIFWEESRLRIRFAEPQRAPARGQSAVLYDGKIVLGGGFIE